MHCSGEKEVSVRTTTDYHHLDKTDNADSVNYNISKDGIGSHASPYMSLSSSPLQTLTTAQCGHHTVSGPGPVQFGLVQLLNWP